jgi:hypothetical protein
LTTRLANSVLVLALNAGIGALPYDPNRASQIQPFVIENKEDVA